MNEFLILLRQINPNFVQNGRVLSPAFRPTSKDACRLSVSDGSRISPQEAWVRFTKIFGYKSVGVLGVTVSECTSCRLSVAEAPVENQPEHMEINFSSMQSTGDITKASKMLCRYATERNWLYYNET
jgi:hypothetical protein